jgi:HD-GYP domain-containing protein (c-di-GMP phosphodiesterase class II)
VCAVKTTIPDNIAEEYYQINPEILGSFPKYRPPLDLFRFHEEIAQLVPYARKGQRLSNEQVDEVNSLCQENLLFVSRSDHPVYSKHICKQLDLVLVDKNLKEGEIAGIFVQALQMRLEAFFDQSVQVVFDTLYQDIMVLTEYLSQDSYRIKALTKRLLNEHNLVNHSVNTGIMGLWLYLRIRGGHFERRELDRTTLAFFLHDMGMSKIPQFIRGKTVPLTQEERNKINLHPLAGMKMAQKLGLSFNEMQSCVFEHHERMDGSGYPRKISGEEISKLGRLCAVVDSFCAMITERPHAKAMQPLDAAQALMKDDKHYDGKMSSLLYTTYKTGDFSW